ncbi:hypothetical protein NC651_034748 [Populus alba x Populus x berolinensis]|nr:hypothetical protein NC651_034748 [Populus alba x Populus x berolinensis]
MTWTPMVMGQKTLQMMRIEQSGESSPEVTDIEAFAKVFFGVERKLGGRAISNKNTVRYCSIGE